MLEKFYMMLIYAQMYWRMFVDFVMSFVNDLIDKIHAMQASHV